EIFTKNPAVSLIDSNGGTALMYALDHSNFYMAEKLLEKGADGRGVFNDTKMTSLMLAVEKCDLDSVTLLLQRDHTQKDAKNAEEKTALDLACEQYLLQNEDEFGCHYDQKTHDTCTKIIELLGGTVPSATPEVPGEVPMVTEPKPVPPINVLPVLPIVAPHVPKPEEIKVPDQTHNTVQKPVKQPSVVNEKKQPISFKNTFKKVFKKWALPGLVTIYFCSTCIDRLSQNSIYTNVAWVPTASSRNYGSRPSDMLITWRHSQTDLRFYVIQRHYQ
ncbi:MAG: hypothetical protein UU47_C0019G0001, partial [candidate division TM6 bacterium GW2011_GWE2_41_16]